MGAMGAGMGMVAGSKAAKGLFSTYGGLGSIIRQKIAEGPATGTGRKYNPRGGNVLGPGETITQGGTIEKGRNPLGFALALDSKFNPEKFKAAGLSFDSRGRIKLPSIIKKRQNKNTKLGSGV